MEQVSGDRVEWAEDGAGRSVRFALDLATGAWTFSARRSAQEHTASGLLDRASLDAIDALAAQVTPADDPGGPDLSASGDQDLRVVRSGVTVLVRHGESEGLPARPEAVVRAILALVPGWTGSPR